jgi:hypothetical protein
MPAEASTVEREQDRADRDEHDHHDGESAHDLQLGVHLAREPVVGDADVVPALADVGEEEERLGRQPRARGDEGDEHRMVERRTPRFVGERDRDRDPEARREQDGAERPPRPPDEDARPVALPRDGAHHHRRDRRDHEDGCRDGDERDGEHGRGLPGGDVGHGRTPSGRPPA